MGDLTASDIEHTRKVIGYVKATFDTETGFRCGALELALLVDELGK